MTHHDRGTLSTIFKRWHVETNTEHFNVNVEEMTPTLEDVWKILRLRVTGVVVNLRRMEKYDDCISRMLGQVPPGGNHFIVQLTWLRNTFKQLPQNYNCITLLQHTRAYLLYLVSRTIFANSVDGIFTAFENTEVAGQYAWGAIALAFLF
ncbi:hypothetical protein AMTR_s00130p00118500 [Amborella trichopoda]|uniref:Aminotransferase-like plant mobile domain-containing protein n=1 Tax=Amborella trichopoda TaxID=13333 RepID=W1NNW4_AMBTC|nr:hypothetical protein AMTR_s00130p00118500 [Amborella trichopoda]